MSDSEEGGEQYELVAGADEGEGEATDDESLSSALKLLQTPTAAPGAAADAAAAPARAEEEEPSECGRAEAPEDFVRNFLRRAGLAGTSEAFETEWYELLAQGKLGVEGSAAVPDAYARCEELEELIRALRAEVASVRAAAATATGSWEHLRAARDFHRLHHQRVAQEKDKLLTDAKRLRTHYAQYEPTIRELRAKYEQATRDATRARAERDRAAARLEALEAQPAPGTGHPGDTQPTPTAAAQPQPQQEPPAAPARHAARGGATPPSSCGVGDGRPSAGAATARAARGSSLPCGTLPRPPGQEDGPIHPPAPCAQLSQLACHPCGGAPPAPPRSVSCLALHPSKPVAATGCDDASWSLWALPGGERLVEGEGHPSWVSCVAFNPLGGQLASGCGAGQLKLWDLQQRRCCATLVGVGGKQGGGALWSVSYHDAGQHLATGSLDRCVRVWDVAVGRLGAQLRGHADSVNEVAWQPCAAGLASASSDKTVSTWDVRAGLCSQTLFGHGAGVNAVAWARSGVTLASADIEGVVKLWDVRMAAELLSLALGPHAANRVAFDPSGAVLAVASDDGTVKCVAVQDGAALATLRGHVDAVQAVAWDPHGEFLLSAGSDGAMCVWGVPPPPPPPAPPAAPTAPEPTATQSRLSATTRLGGAKRNS